MDTFKDKLFLAGVSVFLGIILAIFATAGVVGTMLNGRVFGQHFVSYLIAAFLAASFGMSAVYCFAFFIIELRGAEAGRCAKEGPETKEDKPVHQSPV